MNDAELQDRVMQALHDPVCYPHPAGAVRHIETHISHLLLTGPYAYKIKKPLNLGFLDFSTLDRRRFCCEEELRLNRRLAPDVYLEVVTLNGEVSAPRVNGPGPVLEVAVKMRQFDPETGLDKLDERGLLGLHHVDAMAETVADFHANIPAAPMDSPWGKADTVWQPVAQNFEQIAALDSQDIESRALLNCIRDWCRTEHGGLLAEFERRRESGFVRECHGDLHLGNMAWENDRLLVFDCIEFSPALRWIDVMSEAAFCYMDLLHRGHHDFATRFINRYLERTGDYAGMALLRFYAVYRAMVRAKVAFIRAAQPGLSPEQADSECRQGVAYLRLAESLIQQTSPRLILTHGLSGSGKTTFSRELARQVEFISLRSDIERKRLAGLEELAISGSGMESGLYSQDFSRRTYEHLAHLTEKLLRAGWNVLVDATFIASWQRELFRQLAESSGTPFFILDFDVPEDELRQRVRARRQTGRDASEADEPVLESQIKHQEPLTRREREASIPATSIESVLAGLKAG